MGKSYNCGYCREKPKKNGKKKGFKKQEFDTERQYSEKYKFNNKNKW